METNTLSPQASSSAEMSFSERAKAFKSEANGAAPTPVTAPIIKEETPVAQAPGSPAPQKEKTTAELAAEATASEAQAKIDAANAEVDATKRNELLESTLPPYLKTEKGTEGQNAPEGTTKTTKETPVNNAEIEKIKAEYEIFEKDPVLKAIVDFRKKGGTNLHEFVKEIGFVDVNTLKVEDLYREEAKAYGLKGDELEAEVSAKMEEFEGLTSKVSQSKEEKRLRFEVAANIGEKAKAVTGKATKEQTEFTTIYNNEIHRESAKITPLVNEMEKFDGMPLDEKIKKDILDNVKPSYCEVRDENGKFLGLDAEKGVQTYVREKYYEQIKKAIYKDGFTAGYDAVAKLRNRPSENQSTQHSSIKSAEPIKDAREKFDKERKGVK